MMGPSLQLRPREVFSAFKVQPVPGKQSRKSLQICAGVLTATGPRFQAQDVTVKGTLGEGSYGQVFEVTCLLCFKCTLATFVSVYNALAWMLVLKNSLGRRGL